MPGPLTVPFLPPEWNDVCRRDPLENNLLGLASRLPGSLERGRQPIPPNEKGHPQSPQGCLEDTDSRNMDGDKALPVRRHHQEDEVRGHPARRAGSTIREVMYSARESFG